MVFLKVRMSQSPWRLVTLLLSGFVGLLVPAMVAAQVDMGSVSGTSSAIRAAPQYPTRR
jgi:hypothetical protein